MTLHTQRLSSTELTGRILDMARTGVYRQSVFEAFRSMATQRQIRDAIAQAKQFGLYTVPSLRDDELGTYYQVEAAKYESFLEASKAGIAPQTSEDLADYMVQTNQAIRTMLTAVASCTVGLGLSGGWCLLSGQLQTGRMLWLGALVAGGLWGVQRTIAKRVL
jgi:hypothetical protein